MREEDSYRLSVVWQKKVLPIVRRLPQGEKFEVVEWGTNFIILKATGRFYKLELNELED